MGCEFWTFFSLLVAFQVIKCESGTIDWNQQFSKQCEEFAKILKAQPVEGKIEDNGDLAAPREFTSTVLIGYGKGVLSYWLCGGTLISSSYVLSAGHCARHPQAGPAETALLGDLDIGTDKEETTPRYMDILDIMLHPGYKEGSLEHDLALFRIKDVVITHYIRPACILSTDITGQLWAPGWGATRDSPFLANMRLKKGRALPRDVSTCKSNYDALLSKENICVSPVKSNDLCQSDYGGGLLTIVEVDGMSMVNLVGINTESTVCSQNPSLFTGISPYVPWIGSIILEK